MTWGSKETSELTPEWWTRGEEQTWGLGWGMSYKQQVGDGRTRPEKNHELSPEKTHVPHCAGESLDGSSRGHLKGCAPEG